MCLLMLLTSCATLVVPSKDLTKDCTITYLGGKRGTTSTNEKVAQLARAREGDVRLCNVDKAALRAFYKEQCKGKRCVEK